MGWKPAGSTIGVNLISRNKVISKLFGRQLLSNGTPDMGVNLWGANSLYENGTHQETVCQMFH
jgi:hypothetical protein